MNIHLSKILKAVNAKDKIGSKSIKIHAKLFVE